MIDVIRQVLENLPDDEREQITSALGEWTPESAAQEVAGSLPIYVLWGEHGPCAVGGMLPVIGGIWRSWAAVTDEARTPDNLPRLTDLCVKAYSDRLKAGAERIDVYCLAKRYGVRKWYEAMRLKHAQDLPSYGVDGQDFVRYEVTADVLG